MELAPLQSRPPSRRTTMMNSRIPLTAVVALLLLTLPCCTAEQPQPQGSYTLDPELTFKFTKTRLTMKGGVEPEAAVPLARKLVDDAKGTMDFAGDGSASIRVRLGPEDERNIDCSWKTDGEDVVCTRAEDPAETFALRYVDGSNVVHWVVQRGDHKAVLVFSPTGR